MINYQFLIALILLFINSFQQNQEVALYPLKDFAYQFDGIQSELLLILIDFKNLYPLHLFHHFSFFPNHSGTFELFHQKRELDLSMSKFHFFIFQ